MALVSVPADAWLDGGTTAVKTAVQNRGAFDLLVAVKAAGAPTTEQDGILLAPREAVPIGVGSRIWLRPATPGQATTANIIPIDIV